MQTSRNKVKIGFIGAGDISVLHAEAIQKIDSALLVGLWNITDDLADEKCRLFHCKKYPSAEALTNDPDIDAIFILTSLEAHHMYALMALRAGKHVYVEKPVGATISEIEEMKEAALKSNVICMPGHNYIYEPSVMRAKELLESGRLGDLVSLYVLYNIQHPEAVAARFPGVIRQILTHHAYITLFLAGQPDKVSAMKSVIHYEQITQEDLAMATLKMKNGALVHLCASFAADDHAGDPWTMMIKIIGTKGATRYSYRDWVENTPAQVHSQTYSAYPYTILNADQYFIEECILNSKQPLSGLDDAITAQKIIGAIEESVAEGRHIEI
ncbi:MAG: Gfo/Idh/MocA family oxidoreductase [Saprospiraceae bacterium]|nr:Gfo/Idh/MocA family oxidoreductase [Saprospiraceae bacterium]